MSKEIKQYIDDNVRKLTKSPQLNEEMYPKHIVTQLMARYAQDRCNAPNGLNGDSESEHNEKSIQYIKNIQEFHHQINNISSNLKPFMPQTLKIMKAFRRVFLTVVK